MSFFLNPHTIVSGFARAREGRVRITSPVGEQVAILRVLVARSGGRPGASPSAQMWAPTCRRAVSSTLFQYVGEWPPELKCVLGLRTPLALSSTFANALFPL